MQIRKGTDVSHIAHLLGVPCGAATPRASTWPRDHFCQKTMGPPCALRLGDRTGEVLGRGVLLVFGAPDQLPSLVGQEYGRTIPLAEVAQAGFTSKKYGICGRATQSSLMVASLMNRPPLHVTNKGSSIVITTEHIAQIRARPYRQNHASSSNNKDDRLDHARRP
jgi:hypothetical protein